MVNASENSKYATFAQCFDHIQAPTSAHADMPIHVKAHVPSKLEGKFFWENGSPVAAYG